MDPTASLRGGAAGMAGAARSCKVSKKRSSSGNSGPDGDGVVGPLLKDGILCPNSVITDSGLYPLPTRIPRMNAQAMIKAMTLHKPAIPAGPNSNFQRLREPEDVFEDLWAIGNGNGNSGLHFFRRRNAEQ